MQLKSMQNLRALAAILVFLLHITPLAAQMNGDRTWVIPVTIVNSLGHAGVDIFFVISGVVMSFCLQENQHEPPLFRLVYFLLRRLWRIYPLYWITMISAIIVTPGGFTPNILNIFLIEPTIDFAIAWTLCYEIRFYLVISMLLLFPQKIRIMLLFIWAYFQFCYALREFVIPQPPIPGASLKDPVMLEFLFGVAAGYIYQWRLIFTLRPFLIGCSLGLYAAAALTISASSNPHDFVETWRALFYGIPSALLVLYFISTETHLKTPKFALLSLVGDLSYSIYLWHIPLIILVKRSAFFASGVSFFLANLVLLAFLSFLSFQTIEVPSIRYGRAMANRTLEFLSSLRHSRWVEFGQFNLSSNAIIMSCFF